MWVEIQSAFQILNHFKLLREAQHQILDGVQVTLQLFI